jgi:Domain of unknown function (DUF4922)
MPNQNYISLSDSVKELLEHQKNVWPLLRENYKSLNNVKAKTFRYEGYTIKVQYNPGRIKSTSANVDDESIRNRECFLCEENRSAEQRALIYEKNYLILCNPYPIFPEHFTIAHTKHKPQRIKAPFRDFCQLTKDLSERYLLIYNGPKCGASAPDHLHFQAGSLKVVLPIEDEANLLKNEYGETLCEEDNINITGVNDGIRKFILFESTDEKALNKSFQKFYETFKMISIKGEEPLMNIISTYDEEFGWKLIIFLRSKHRSSHYYREGNDKILISPAAIDLGGTCITPLEKDFDKVNKKLLSQILHEVTLSKEEFDYIKSTLQRKLN